LPAAGTCEFTPAPPVPAAVNAVALPVDVPPDGGLLPSLDEHATALTTTTAAMVPSIGR
jgi:hypothetical protein